MGAYIYDPVEKKLVPIVSNDDHLTDKMIAGYEASNLATNAYSVGEQLIYNGKLYTVTSPIAVDDDITNKIAESESLSKQLLGYEKKIWKGTEEEWEALSAAEKANYTTAIITNDTINSPVEFQGATENTNGTKGLVKQPLAGDQNKVLFGDGSWKRINNDISNLAPAYDSTLTYDVDDLVTYIDSQGSGKLYKCIVAVTTPEAFNINKWDDVTASIAFKYTDKIATFSSTGGTTTTGDLLNWLYSILSTVTNFSNTWLERVSTDNSIVTHWRFTDIGSNIINLHNVTYGGGFVNNNFIRININDVTQSFINTSSFQYTDGSYSRTNEDYGTTVYSATSYKWTLHY